MVRRAAVPLVLMLSLCPLAVRAEAAGKVDALIAGLRASDWATVRSAEEQLESLQEKAVPALLALLDSRDVVPLTNTADLIYPGAKTFYGHGYIVNYALDSLAVRAGWVLESITFQDFGFRSGTISEDALFRAMREHPGDMPLEQAVGPQEMPEPGPVARSAERARQWWAKAGKGWTRYKGVLAALDSGDVARQREVLSWLRWGLTDCAGLDGRTFESQVRPRVRKLAASPDRGVKEQAELLLEEGLHWGKRLQGAEEGIPH